MAHVIFKNHPADIIEGIPGQQKISIGKYKLKMRGQPKLIRSLHFMVQFTLPNERSSLTDLHNELSDLVTRGEVIKFELTAL